MTQGMRTKRWTSNKIREMAVCVLTRCNHTYGKGYHGSGSLFPFNCLFNYRGGQFHIERLSLQAVFVLVLY